MESNADENSPPRSDLVAKTRRQSTLLDSPSRVTRSQVRRFSNAPVDPPMSPKPTVTRRRSVRVSESFSDVASQEDASSIQDEAESVKPVQRPRRSTRRSFADTTEALPSQRSTLTSIEEDTKPVTRRTRASLKPVEEIDTELILPPTRRTRRSSVSSVTSVSTIASNAQSPQRRTRASRRNLSPVPSPTFSEVSVISEVPEVSPTVKKFNSPMDNDLNSSSKSLTPVSSNVSPALLSSGKTPNSAETKRFSIKEKSPMLKTSETSFTTPRMLNLNDTGSSSKKRSSLNNEEIEIIDINDESENTSNQKSRLSQGRLSLTTRRSTPQKLTQFVESPMQSNGDEISNDPDLQPGKPPRASVGSGNAETERPRRNSGRLSLSKFVEAPLSNSAAQESGKLNVSPHKDVDFPANVSSGKLELDKSLNSSRRLSVSKFVEKPLEESFKNSPSKPAEDFEPEKSGRQSIGRSSLSSVKSPELEKSQRKSVGRLSLTSNNTNDPNLEDEYENQAEMSSRKSTGRLSVSSKSPELEKSQRNSIGRLSLASNKSTNNIDSEIEEIQPEKSIRKSVGRDSVSPVKSPNLEKSRKMSVSVERLSLNFNKSLRNTDSDCENNQLEISTVKDSVSAVKSPELEKSQRKSIGGVSFTSNKSLSNINTESEIDQLDKSSRKSTGRNSTSPVKSPELEKSQRMSVGRLSLTSNKSMTLCNNDPDVKADQLEKSSQISIGRDSVSPVKSPELEKSQRKSVGRLSLTTSDKSSNDINCDDENENQGEKSGRKSTSSVSASPINSAELEKSRRNSIGRLSLSSNKSSPIKLDNTPHLTPRDVKNLRTYFASSTPTAFIQKEQSPMKEYSLVEKSDQSMGRSSGRLSLTPSKLSKDDDQDDDQDDQDDQDVDAESHESDSDNICIEIPASTSRRASADISLFKRTLESESKGKNRASTGSLPHKSPLKSMVLNCGEESLSTSHINNVSKGSSHGNNSSSFNDKTKIGMSEDLNVSPIKRDQGELKNLTLTPSSSGNSFNESLSSPNHALEKSTVFNEKDVSFGSHTGTNVESEHSLSTSRPSSRMNLSQHNQNSTNDSSVKTSDKRSPFKKSVEVSVSSDTGSETDAQSNSRASGISSRVYKDAAILLSGGNISDFDDQEDDDADQWQRFSPPGSKSKKELRLEKKAKKKAEKEIRRKAKVERVKEVKATEDSDVSESNHEETSLQSHIQESEDVVNINETEEIIQGDKISRKRRSGSSDLSTSRVKDQSSEFSAVTNDVEKSVTKRKSLPDSDINVSTKKICLEPVENDIFISLVSDDKDNVETLLDDFVDITSDESVDCVEPRSNPSEKLKKKKKKKLVQVKTGQDDIPVVEGKIKKTKKNKLKQQAFNIEDESVESDKPMKKKKKVKDQSNIENESEGQIHDIKKKKKKVKTQAIAEEGSVLLLKKKKKVAEQVETEDTMKLVKKKKKKVQVQESTEAESDTVKVVKKKKKAKTVEDQTLAEDVLEELSNNLGKKKLKKKFKESSETSPLDLNSEPSAKLIKKKKKKNNAALVETTVAFDNGNGSDSDEAPTSVSFAAGKESALAELSAAAESIKKQKELKKQKLRIKQERIKEEKLAKMKKLKKKQKLIPKQLEERNTNSSTGISMDGSSYKIYFDGENNPQKSKLPKRLPDEFLESISEQPPTKLVRRADGSKERVAAAAVSKEEQEHLERKRAKKLARKMEKQRMLQADYVPLEGVLGSTRFGVVPLRNIMLAKKLEKNKLAEEAANFRQQSLFGNRIRRTPISTVLSHKEKLKASGKDHLVKSK